MRGGRRRASWRSGLPVSSDATTGAPDGRPPRPTDRRGPDRRLDHPHHPLLRRLQHRGRRLDGADAAPRRRPLVPRPQHGLEGRRGGRAPGPLLAQGRRHAAGPLGGGEHLRDAGPGRHRVEHVVAARRALPSGWSPAGRSGSPARTVASARSARTTSCGRRPASSTASRTRSGAGRSRAPSAARSTRPPGRTVPQARPGPATRAGISPHTSGPGDGPVGEPTGPSTGKASCAARAGSTLCVGRVSRTATAAARLTTPSTAAPSRGCRWHRSARGRRAGRRTGR